MNTDREQNPELVSSMPANVGARVGEVIFGCHVSGSDPASGEVPPDPVAEAHNLMQNLAASVESCGGTLDQVAQVTLRLADTRRGLAALNPIWAELFPDPDDRPTYKFIPGTFAGGASMDADYFAVVGSPRQSIHINGVAHTNPIPMAVRIGDYLFTSRILPIDPEIGREAPAAIQGAQVFKNAQAVLDKAQMRWEDVSQGRVFLQDPTMAPALHTMWRQHTLSGERIPLHVQRYVTVPALQVMLEMIAHKPSVR